MTPEQIETWALSATLTTSNKMGQLHADRSGVFITRWHQVRDAEFARLVAADTLERAAKVCEQQATEPECPERAQYCADALRAEAAKEPKP